MKLSRVRTWIQLYERLGRQPYSKNKGSSIVLKESDGSFSKLKLVYNDTGSNWWFERIEEVEVVE